MFCRFAAPPPPSTPRGTAMQRVSSRRLMSTTLFLLSVAAVRAGAQNSDPASAIAADKALLAKESYQMPPAAIAKLVTAPRHLNVSLGQPSPDRRLFLKQESE